MSTPASHRRRLLAPVALIVILLLFIWVSRVVLAASRVQSDARLLQSLGGADLLASAPAETESLLNQTTSDFRDLRGAVGPVAYLLPAFGWLPRYGGDLANAPALLEFGDRALTAAQDTLAVGRTVQNAIEAGRAGRVPVGVALLQATQSESARIQRARQNLVKAADARRQIDAVVLSPSFQDPLNRLDGWLPLWQMGIEALENAPALLGADRPRVYLLIAQNSDELRPTGGFVSGVALLQIDAGKITVGEFKDSFAVDDLTKEHPDAPEPLYQYMSAWQWLFRDSNWSPDLPTSARQLIRMYELDRGITADGVIALNLQALPRLVQAAGPITLESYNERIDSTNVAARIRKYWATPQVGQGTDWWSHRKDFIGDLFAALMNRLLAGEFDQAQLARELSATATSKDLWVYLEGSDTHAPLTFPPSGSLYRGSGDALMVVDSNLGFNKVDGSVKRELQYTVEVEPAGTLRATALITYTNLSPSTNTYCVHQPLYFATYADLQQGCYWDYVRVVAPAGSELLSAAGIGQVTKETEAGRTVFGGYMVLPRAELRQVRLVYRMPATVLKEGNRYSLRVEKQPGAPVMAAQVRVVFPAEWEITSSSSPAAQRNKNTIDLSFDLDRDQQLSIAAHSGSFLLWPAVALGLSGALLLGIFVYSRRKNTKVEQVR